jgi:xylan 1,4-beta-xylosidase
MRGFLLLLLVISAALVSAESDAAEVQVQFDLNAASEPFPHYWERCVGTGHMLLGTRADWYNHLNYI